MTTLIRYVGEDRHGWEPGQSAHKRFLVPHDSNGILIERVRGSGNLVEVRVEGRRLRFWAPRWQLRKLVKK